MHGSINCWGQPHVPSFFPMKARDVYAGLLAQPPNRAKQNKMKILPFPRGPDRFKINAYCTVPYDHLSLGFWWWKLRDPPDMSGAKCSTFHPK